MTPFWIDNRHVLILLFQFHAAVSFVFSFWNDAATQKYHCSSRNKKTLLFPGLNSQISSSICFVMLFGSRVPLFWSSWMWSINWLYWILASLLFSDFSRNSSKKIPDVRFTVFFFIKFNLVHCIISIDFTSILMIA